MRILHICGSCFYKEGMGYQENILPKMHFKQGFETYIMARAQVTYKNNGGKYAVENYINQDGIPVIIIDYKQFNNCKLLNKACRILKIYANILSQLQSINPDIIFVHGGQFASLEVIRKYVKKRKNVKLYIDQHMDYYNEPKGSILMTIVNKLFGFQMRRCVPYTNKYWGVTPWRCDYLRDVYKIPNNKIGLLVMGGDDDFIEIDNKTEIRNKIRKQYLVKDEDFCIISGGKIDRAKNIHLLLEAFSRIDSNQVKLFVFGNISQEMKDEIELYIHDERIIYLGWINSHEVYKYYLASDLAVFPGTHSVLWEQACACGLPGLYKNWPGMHHVDVGGNCRFLSSENTDEIKKCIEDIINDRNGYIKMKEVAEQIGEKVFSYKEISKRAIECNS